MKLSNFNEYFAVDNGLIIYNHLSKKLVKIRDMLLLKDINSLQNVQFAMQLSEYGITLADEVDEK